nr:penicillin-binding protein activator [Sodalis-like endosymbiont of Proechinophthirus fluctus]
MILDPLLKNDMEQLDNDNTSAKAAGTLSILALNQLEYLQSRPNICYFALSTEYFALSPEDETRNEDNHIHQQDRQRFLPRSALGYRVAKAFSGTRSASPRCWNSTLDPSPI